MTRSRSNYSKLSHMYLLRHMYLLHDRRGLSTGNIEFGWFELDVQLRSVLLYRDCHRSIVKYITLSNCDDSRVLTIKSDICTDLS